MTVETAIQLGLFLVISALLSYWSRASLRVPRSHGFYRYLAWECIAALFVLEVMGWFRDAFSPMQLISWALLFLSAFLVLHAVYLLRRHGRLDRARQDVPLIGVEKTTALVTEGAYRYIRHPMYSSLLCLAWGIFFKGPTLLAGGLAAAATGLLYATARADEAASARYFSGYRAYMKRTRMFIPFVF